MVLARPRRAGSPVLRGRATAEDRTAPLEGHEPGGLYQAPHYIEGEVVPGRTVSWALEARDKLPSQPWMEASGIRAVVAALTAEGAEIRFVGGCVRDTVLGRPIQDIDIATHDVPETVMRLLRKAGIRVIPTGIDYGTVTAVIGAAHFEITTLRIDVEAYGRRAKVEYTDDWAADAARRDFTINALALAPDGTLFDPFGGLDDLESGRVRFIGDGEARVREDVLRLLRFFRFHAHYGRPPPDAAALAACRALAPLLPSLSGERVAGELFKLLTAPDPAGVLALMADEGVLAHFLPEAKDIGRLRALVTVEAATIGADPLRRLAAVLEVDAAGAGAVADRLRLSNVERERLVAVAAPPESVTAELDAAARRRALHRLGAGRFRDLALLAWAGALADRTALAAKETAGWRRLLAAAGRWKPVELPVKGKDVVALGVAPGPEVGRLLEAAERWWVDGDFRATRAQCLARLEELIGETD